MIRQGDVLVRRVNSLPNEAVQLQTEGPVILARGEATGHAHALEEADLFRDDERLYVVLGRETSLTHEEHDTVRLGPGIWEVLRQRSYEPRGNRLAAD